jgi:hypothetical protein
MGLKDLERSRMEHPLVRLTVYGLSVEVHTSPPFRPRQGADVVVQFRSDGPLFSAPPPATSNHWYVSAWSDEGGTPELAIRCLPSGQFWWRYGYGVEFLVDRAGAAVQAAWSPPATAEDAFLYLVGSVLGFVRWLRGAPSLHASAVAVAGRAILLVGSSGAGKSTTAAALAQRGLAVLTDDVAPLVEQRDVFLVQPGLPRLLLLPETLRSVGRVADSSPGLSPAWDKLAVGPAAHGFAFCPEPLPLGGIYLLGDRQANVSTPTLQPLTGAEALIQVAANSYLFRLLSPTMRAEEFTFLSRVLRQVPVRLVRRPDDTDRLDALCDVILEDCRSLGLFEPRTPGQTHV